jgi:hypothetical protein
MMSTRRQDSAVVILDDRSSPLMAKEKPSQVREVAAGPEPV